MIRPLHILLTALLVATHVVAVPLHVAVDHGHQLFGAAGYESFLHAHAPEGVEAHHHIEVAEEACGHAVVFDASDFGSPHHHGAHAHAITDHGAARSRFDDVLPVVCMALLPLADTTLHPAAYQKFESNKSPPRSATSLRLPTLRGPPVG